MRLEPVRLVDMGEGWVLAEVIVTGTNDGPYMGILPATGNHFTQRTATLYRIDTEGVITDKRMYWDELTNMVQLGLMEL